jgi:hypothetical protein
VAYISSDREGGQGDMDIWRIVFNEVQQTSFTIVTGSIIGDDGTISYPDLTIIVTNSAGEEVGNYRFNAATKKYVMALAPGKYSMKLEVPGFQAYTKNVNVFDIGPQGEMSQDILLVK